MATRISRSGGQEVDAQTPIRRLLLVHSLASPAAGATALGAKAKVPPSGAAAVTTSATVTTRDPHGPSPTGDLANVSCSDSRLSYLSRNSGRFIHSPGSWSKNSSGIFCRICHDGEASERLISPCQCSGSVALVHRSCIEKWLSTANHDTCELCHHKYQISRHPRPFAQWLCSRTHQDDQRNLVGDVVCFFLLTPLALISTYLCASGAAFYLEEKQSESIGLICLCVVLVFIYIAWVLLTLRYHVQVWMSWRNSNQEIRLEEMGREPVPSNQWRGTRLDTISERTSRQEDQGRALLLPRQEGQVPGFEAGQVYQQQPDSRATSAIQTENEARASVMMHDVSPASAQCAPRALMSLGEAHVSALCATRALVPRDEAHVSARENEGRGSVSPAEARASLTQNDAGRPSTNEDDRCRALHEELLRVTRARQKGQGLGDAVGYSPLQPRNIIGACAVTGRGSVASPASHVTAEQQLISLLAKSRVPLPPMPVRSKPGEELWEPLLASSDRQDLHTESAGTSLRKFSCPSSPTTHIPRRTPSLGLVQ